MDKLKYYIEGMLELFGVFGFIAAIIITIVFLFLCVQWKYGKLLLIFTTMVLYLIAMATPRPGGEMRLPAGILIGASVMRWFLLILVCMFGWGNFFKNFRVGYFLVCIGISGFILLSSIYTRLPSESMPIAVWLVIMLFGLPLMGRAIVVDYNGFETFLRWWRGTGLVLVFMFVAYTIMDPYRSFMGPMQGYRGILENPNAYGWLAVSMIVPILSIFSYERKLGFLSILQLLWWVPTAFLSASRSSMGLLVIVLVGFGINHLRNIKIWLIAGGVLLLLFVTYSYLITEEQAQELTDTSLSGRESLWSFSWNSFRERPLLGYGAGFVETELRSMLRMDLHNSYLLLLLNYGVIGTIILLPLYISSLFMTQLFSKRVQLVWGKTHEVLKWYIGGMMCWAFFEAWLAAPGSGVLYMYLLLIGVLKGIYDLASDNFSRVHNLENIETADSVC